MTHAELVGTVAHVYAGGKAGHRAAVDCPCRPALPLASAPARSQSYTDIAAELVVHRPLPDPRAMRAGGGSPWRY